MATVFPSRTLNISIASDPGKVADFISNPANLPRWAAGLCLSIRQSAGGWIAETPHGPVKIRFVEKNRFGVLDHYVTAPGLDVHVPMRVVPNGTGSELLFTLFRLPDMADEKFAEDTHMVQRDLETLKAILEGGAAGFPAQSGQT